MPGLLRPFRTWMENRTPANTDLDLERPVEPHISSRKGNQVREGPSPSQAVTAARPTRPTTQLPQTAMEKGFGRGSVQEWWCLAIVLYYSLRTELSVFEDPLQASLPCYMAGPEFVKDVPHHWTLKCLHPLCFRNEALKKLFKTNSPVVPAACTNHRHWEVLFSMTRMLFIWRSWHGCE